MAARPYVVEWVIIVDHPELRDASYPKVPRFTRIRYVERVATFKGAVSFHESLIAGNYDSESEYVGLAKVTQIDAKGRPRIVRQEVHRERTNGKPHRLKTDRYFVEGGPRMPVGPVLYADRPIPKGMTAALQHRYEQEQAAAAAVESTPATPRGELFTTEQAGFALTAPRGEYGRGMQSQGTQQELISRKVDAAKMAEIVERERAERAARAGSRSAQETPALPLPPEASSAPEAPAEPPEALPWELEEAAPPAPPPASFLAEKEEATAPEGEARLEFVDVATGEPRSPEAPGTAASGQLVAELEGAAVVVDPEDVIGRSDEADPRRRRYRFDLESPADYPAQARRRKAIRQRKPKPIRRPRVPGVQTTFRSPAAAARTFYSANAAYFDNVRDPIDGLRDWADGIDVAVSRGRSKRLATTQHGQRIFAASRGQGQIEAALRYVFGQAKGRRWDRVAWQEIDRLDAALRPHYEHAPGGTAGITWRPDVGELDVATLDTMPPDVVARVRDYESHREIKAALEDLRTAYRRTRQCIPPELRRTVLHRIKAWSGWERAPERIPAYACEPDERSGGHLCNYPAVAGELRELRRACERAYDPDWALPDARAGAPGFPDLSAGEADVAPRPLPVLLRPEPLPVPPAVATPTPSVTRPSTTAAVEPRGKTPRKPAAGSSEIIEAHGSATAGRHQYSRRADGQVFERHQERNRYGLRWTAWRPVEFMPEGRVVEGRARLPGAQPSKTTRAKTKPHKAARPTKLAPIKTPEATPHKAPKAIPTAPTEPTAKKKPKAAKKATRTEIEECASLLGKRGAEAKARRRRERLSDEERAKLLDDALELATL